MVNVPTTRANRRRAVTSALVAISLVTLLGMASLTVDLGMAYRARNEAQSSADAAAMAAAWRMMDQNRLRGGSYVDSVNSAARQQAVTLAQDNQIINKSPTLDTNGGNGSTGDIVLGRLVDPNNGNEAMAYANAAQFNAVHVFLHRDATRNGPISLYFAGIFGKHSADISASATAAFYDGVIGWHVTQTTGNAGILPFALRKSVWDQLMAGTFTTGDHYSYDENTKKVVSGGPDGINELNLYPGAGAGQLPPGNFGTVDIGAPGNSTSDIVRQITEGVNASDLAYFGGTLQLGADGTLMLNGDTGLSGGISSALESIIGLPRALPIFSEVSGPGNNSIFTIVGFVGVRILDVKLTGSMNSKKVIIQPAYVMDDSVVVSKNSGQSSFVYKPVQLVK
ncbi:MAG: hypothetical protein HY287_00715 [Planctomycetes bacterium]|nr:hypothetical protein [Planctomycetota bacterium]MBI3832830.1 hypothetical protein [Planctomycetota bacterium]